MRPSEIKDLYERLGIAPNADFLEIKKAYWKMATNWHPDTCKDSNAHDEFIAVSFAYETLSDADKKRVYDNPELKDTDDLYQNGWHAPDSENLSARVNKDFSKYDKIYKETRFDGLYFY